MTEATLATTAAASPVCRRSARTTFILPLLLFLLVALCWALPAFAALPGEGMLQGAHGDTSVMPKTCRSCHRGMSMAISGEEGSCLTCHGSRQARQKMIAAGYLRPDGSVHLANIEAQLRKPYNHPVLTIRGVHREGETLPEEAVNAPRHSECVDCHNPHEASRENPLAGITGRHVGNFVTNIDREYQLCYKCHSTSANLPANETNVAAEFRPTNPSYHPVEAEGADAYVVSLKTPYVARKKKPGEVSIIGCADCHGNDNPNGPKGPHGSRFRGLLTNHYEQEDGRPESEYAYDLCYKCHDRASILGNESFPYHAQHIEGNPGSGWEGTSCNTCHNPHGSTRYQYLIRFNKDVVRPATDGKLEFDASGVGTRHGSCYLSCHGVEHDPKAY